MALDVMMLRVNSIWALRGISSSNRGESRPSSRARFALLSWHSSGRTFHTTSSSSSRPRKSRLATLFCYSDSQQSFPGTSIEELRRQLESLNLEAEQARGRANAARARFMRLTETVENLRMRAVTELKSGNEGSARQLIGEKQKVMQALEKSKQRAELLEELCNKLGEVISSKERQVMASLSSTAVGVDESSNTGGLNVRIVSPKANDLAYDGAAYDEKIGDFRREDMNGRMNSLNDQNVQDSRSYNGADDDDDDDDVSDSAKETDDRSTDAVSAMLSSRAEMYPDFLSRVDNHLQEAEVQLHGFLNIAAMVMPKDVNEKSKEKVNVVRQIWQDVLVARARIRKAVQAEDFG